MRIDAPSGFVSLLNRAAEVRFTSASTLSSSASSSDAMRCDTIRATVASPVMLRIVRPLSSSQSMARMKEKVSGVPVVLKIVLYAVMIRTRLAWDHARAGRGAARSGRAVDHLRRGVRAGGLEARGRGSAPMARVRSRRSQWSR